MRSASYLHSIKRCGNTGPKAGSKDMATSLSTHQKGVVKFSVLIGQRVCEKWKLSFLLDLVLFPAYAEGRQADQGRHSRTWLILTQVW